MTSEIAPAAYITERRRRAESTCQSWSIALVSTPCPSFGFIVTIVPHAEVDDLALTALWDEWIAFLARRGLQCSGAGDGAIEYVVAGEASQATELDREATESWLAVRAELARWNVGALLDLSERD